MNITKEQISKAKEKIGERAADIIAEILHLEKYDSKNHKALCPFHKEDTPSFIYNTKDNYFHCFGCGRTVGLLDAYIATGNTYLEAVEKLSDESGVPISLGEKGVRTKYQYHYPKEEQKEDREAILKYLAIRGISQETADKLDVRQDVHGNIVFNYYDTNDVLTMVKYRPSHKIVKGSGEPKCWFQKDADTNPLLYNMNRVVPELPLLITEGEIDTMAAIESGYTNSVSIPFGCHDFKWIEENFDWLEQFDSIIVCSDNDVPGIEMQKECVFRLGSWRTKVIDIPRQVTDANGVVHNIKDLNEVLFYCGKQSVLDLIQSAKDSPVPSVDDFSDVHDIDLDEIDGIYTGIQEVDSQLMKLFYGTLTVVSGVPGSGKSSFLSQLICQALEQGKNTWLFSREMPGWMSKSWLNYILASGNNVRAYKDSNGTPFYKVPSDVKEMVNDHYRGKWYVYKDDASNKLDDLLISMTDSVKKYGTRLLILDNLMTIDLGSNESNELLKQTDAITKLIGFAMKYNTAVVLVAHPRKMQSDAEVGIYDISGSSNIINLAHRTIGISRIKNKEDTHDVRLTIIKDRMRGRAGEHIDLYYDVPTRRFYTNEKEYNFQYSWDQSKHPYLPYPHEEENEVYGEIHNE